MIFYTAKATAVGGREGEAFTDDGKVKLSLALPRTLGGSGKEGTNPEQLFALGYAACFENALLHVAKKQKIDPGAVTVKAEVGIGPRLLGGFQLDVELQVDCPKLEKAAARELALAAHEVCPYSNAVKGNIDVRIKATGL
jgi:osmotically inducible protein OsmC